MSATDFLLPVQPPVRPMLAELARALPDGGEWLYEPKWDGFRAIVFWDGVRLLLQSRDQKPLDRYFPELVDGLRRALPAGVVVDGEVVIANPGTAALDFDALQQRIHPAASRIQKLARETPASFVAFDLLAADGQALLDRPLAERRARLEACLAHAGPPVTVTPASPEHAVGLDWFARFEGAGLDGVVAKRLADAYQPNRRAMLKVKHQRTVDCVVGGFRWNAGEEGRSVGSLLLGLYDAEGVLHHVGHTASFTAAQKRDLVQVLRPYRAEPGSANGDGFGRGRTPGEPSRWTSMTGRDTTWEPLRPERVCEVAFDHLQGDRFRHAATFLRWRHDKPPADCTYAQITATAPAELQHLLSR